MKNESQNEIKLITKELEQLRLRQQEIDISIKSAQRRLKDLTKIEETINDSHIGRSCIVLNPHLHQPTSGVILGFTKGKKPLGV